MEKKLIYMDNAATTKTAPEVVEAMLPYFTEMYGNPSTVYDLAGKSKAAIMKAREQAAAVLPPAYRAGGNGRRHARCDAEYGEEYSVEYGAECPEISRAGGNMQNDAPSTANDRGADHDRLTGHGHETNLDRQTGHGPRTRNNRPANHVRSDDWKLRKEEQARRRKIENDLKKCEKAIADLESEGESIDEQISLPENSTDPARLRELTENRNDIDARLASLYDQWEELSELADQG